MIAVIISTLIILAIPIAAIYVLFRFNINVYDNPDFWYSYMAYFGTVILGAIALVQNINAQKANKKLSEDNIRIQNIMAQKLLPIVRVDTAKTYHSVSPQSRPLSFPETTRFISTRQDSTADQDKQIQKVYVNIDVEDGVPAYVKQVTLNLVNITDAIIRSICVDDIVVTGIQDCLHPVRCTNSLSGNGISALLSTNDSVEVKIILYTNNEELVSFWDDPAGGLCLLLYVTNNSINGTLFHEFIDMRITNDGRIKIKYGEKTNIVQ